MKELSIEEKAKRYDEVLESAKGIIEQNPLMEYLKKGIEYIFPELKESEDERIRQKFIKLVKMSSEVGGFALHKWEADEMLTWLEKQGEQKPTLRERYKNIANSEWFKKTHDGMSISDDEKVDNVNKIFERKNKRRINNDSNRKKI